jgi:oxygen-independent coproporphyrinogen-3 oxidase
MGLQLENRDERAPAGLYIHVPFCRRKCPYCAFYSVTDLHRVEAFVEGLIQEMDLVTLPGAAFDTIYIGGGTPSLLKRCQVLDILQGAHRRFDFIQDLEVTIEVNPDTLSLDALRAFLGHGVNRVNMGVQSFDDQRLRFLGRIHSARKGHQAIRLARKAGVENLGLDLMYGLPNQSRKGWLLDLSEATNYEPEHLSCYMLTYEGGTPLDRWRKAGRFRPLNEDAVRDLFEVTVDFLGERGYEQYEISNFARERAFRARHNQKYWFHGPYVGLGPSAHSFLAPMRWWNQRSLGKYLQALGRGVLPVEGREQLNQGQLMLESVFLGLRTADGVNVLGFKKRYDVDFLDRFGAVLERLEAQDLVSVSADRCTLTMEGMVVADTISGMLAEYIRI